MLYYTYRLISLSPCISCLLGLCILHMAIKSGVLTRIEIAHTPLDTDFHQVAFSFSCNILKVSQKNSGFEWS